MNLTKLTIPKFNAGKKFIATILIGATTIVSFGALGDGNKKSAVTKKPAFLSGKTYSQNSFSLKSGYTYRGSKVLSTPTNNQFISLNTVVTHQRGNTTYIVPLKKKVILDKVKIELGNRQFKSN